MVTNVYLKNSVIAVDFKFYNRCGPNRTERRQMKTDSHFSLLVARGKALQVSAPLEFCYGARLETDGRMEVNQTLTCQRLICLTKYNSKVVGLS